MFDDSVKHPESISQDSNTTQTNNYIIIELTRGYQAIVDHEDADLADYNWSAQVGGKTCYAKRNAPRSSKSRTKIQMHRVILSRILGRELLPGELTDHINGNGLDNRRSNLRVANPAQNIYNTRTSASNKSGYKGVHQLKRNGRWQATIGVNGKKIHLGMYATAEEAHAAYCAAANFYHGEFANSGSGSIADYIKSISGGVAS